MQKTYHLTLIAMLAALAISGRFAFQFLPNIQPVTSLVILTGFFFGPLSAMLLSLVTVYLSNVFLGMGIWTIWQIVAYSIIGLLGSYLGKVMAKHSFIIISIFAVLSGFIYGLLFALINYLISGLFLGYYLSGLIFDLYHALGNLGFIFVAYKPFSLLATKYRHDHHRTMS